MKPIPDLADKESLARTGRRSLLMRSRNEACEALRDVAVIAQGQDIESAGDGLGDAAVAVERLKLIARLWRES